MTKRASTFNAVMRVLPEVQAAVCADISARIAAGEAISRVEDGRIISQRPATRDLRARRKELLEGHAVKRAKRDRAEHKTLA